MNDFTNATHAILYSEDGEVVVQARILAGEFEAVDPQCVPVLAFHRRRPDVAVCYCGVETFNEKDTV